MLGERENSPGQTPGEEWLRKKHSSLCLRLLFEVDNRVQRGDREQVA